MSNRDELRTRLESLMEQRRSVDGPFAGPPVEAPLTPDVERVAVELDGMRDGFDSERQRLSQRATAPMAAAR